jgi:hypothetical protein
MTSTLPVKPLLLIVHKRVGSPVARLRKPFLFQDSMRHTRGSRRIRLTAFAFSGESHERIGVGPMDHETAHGWLDRYVDAWMSYDPDDVSGLFTEDVAYRYHPYDEPIVGRNGRRRVLARRDWVGWRLHPRRTWHPTRPSTLRSRSTVTPLWPPAHRGELSGEPVVRTYENCLAMRFDGEGRCREFTEYYLRCP